MSLLDTHGKPVTIGDVSITTLETLGKHVIAGKIALPGFQRPQVWNDQERKELVISLCLGVPIGSYLLWEYDSQVQKDTEVVEFPHVSTNKQNVDYLLIDGQQRMTTISQLTTSDFAKHHKVEFRQVSANLTRPVIHKIKAVPNKKPYQPDLSTINNKREIRLCDLAGNAKISSLDSDAKQQAGVFRQSLKGTNVPVHVFGKNEDRQWVVYVYQTCNLAGKPLSDTDHAEAALGYVYPELKDKIDTYAKSLTLWSTTSNTPRKLILRSMLDEIYKSPHFSYCKKHGLDVLDPRIITTKANMNRGIAEVSTSLTRKLVEDALKSTKRAFSKLQDLFISSWELKNEGDLGENEILVMLAWYREHDRSKSIPTKTQVGEMSKHMMLSMALKTTTGGSTQQMTTTGCNLVRNSLATCWDDIQADWNYKDLEGTDFGNTYRETAQKPHSSFIFHLYKLSIFRNSEAVDIFDSTPITSSTKEIQIDHFYPSSRLGQVSEDYSLKKRRNHLANFVVMKGWSNNSKKDIIPDHLISEKSKWPGKDPSKKANFEAHCIPRISNSGIWIKKGQERFNELKEHIKQVRSLDRKIKSATPAQVKVFKTAKDNHLEEIDKLSKSIESQYTKFLNNRSKKMAAVVNKMLDEFKNSGF